jgi:hypothetical protein
LPALAGDNALPQVAIGFFLGRTGFENTWRLAQHFFLQVAAVPAEGRVGVFDAPLQIGDEDRHRTLIERLRQPPDLFAQAAVFGVGAEDRQTDADIGSEIVENDVLVGVEEVGVVGENAQHAQGVLLFRQG